ncbi:hypothetical protein FOMPIDRAFT_1015128 [Fomitopsis schrenkii]|uniref:Uncharacterized protein n=1 Tax=Fomitopsis schrenkii TaxID=2126942 RepID=S8EHX1_FOMSC|nr:hypothetical protein FOMPIDRAFT_1015128 [Fomitopsis schrenkii]
MVAWTPAAMVNWKNPTEVLQDTDVYEKLVFALFGLYVWELFQTSGFEWSLITRTRKLTWPLINCEALYTFNSWAGNMAILGASTSLMLRTIAIWERKLKVVIPLCFLCLAHWALLWRGMFLLDVSYNADEHACMLQYSNHIFLNVTFFMTWGYKLTFLVAAMGFDLTILAFTLTYLMRHKARTSLWSLLFTDGLVYFITAFCFNALPAILNVINLNVAMDVVATVPAACFSSIAACRAVIRLQEFARPDVYVHTASQIVSGGSAQSPNYTGGGASRAVRRFTTRRNEPQFARPEVHVTTDQFVVEDYRMKPLSPISPGSEGTRVKFEGSDYDLDKMSEVEEEDKAAYPIAEAV